MRDARPTFILVSGVVCLLCCLSAPDPSVAQGEALRPGRRGVPAAAPPGNAPGQAPQPLAASARISLDERGLSVDVQEQDLPAVVERIAALARIELRHPEGMPNRRVSIRFAGLPLVDGLRRLFRTAEVPGYMLVTGKQGSSETVQRILFLPEEGGASASLGRNAARPTQAAAVPPLQPPRPTIPPPPVPGAAPPPAPPQPQEEVKTEEGRNGGTIFDEIKSNAAARRLLSQMMHPNEQVRDRALEGLVRLVREDEKQRALMELLEPLMEDMSSEDKATQDEAREEIRKLLSR